MTTRFLRLLALAAALGLGACAGTPPSHFFLLGPPADEAAQAPSVAAPQPAKPGAPLLFVDPVVVAAYADRSQMVTRQADGQVGFAEFQVWAEPIGNLVTTTLVDDIGLRLGPDRVMATPGRLDFDAPYRLTVDVLRFDVDADNQAVVDARWTLLRSPDGRLVTTRREQVAQPVADPMSYPARVAAFRRAIDALSGSIAGAIQAGGPAGK